MTESLEGRTGVPFRMAIELGKIREFARATKSTSSAYDGEPGDRPVVPGTFLTTERLWQDEASSPWGGHQRNMERVLHGQQEYVFHGEPPRAGDVLTGQARIDRVYTKTGKRGGTMTFTEIVTEFRDPEGRLVAEARSTGIETSRAVGT